MNPGTTVFYQALAVHYAQLPNDNDPNFTTEVIHEWESLWVNPTIIEEAIVKQLEDYAALYYNISQSFPLGLTSDLAMTIRNDIQYKYGHIKQDYPALVKYIGYIFCENDYQL